MKRVVFILIPIITYFGCSHKVKSKYTFSIKNTKGELNTFTYKIVNKDSILDGPAVFYWENGKVKQECWFKNGEKSGWNFLYDSLGNLQNKTFYRNGLIDGTSITYGFNKNVIDSGYYIKGKRVFEERFQKQLTPSGIKSVPKSYEIFGETGKVQYVVFFDSLGNKFYENGFIFDTKMDFTPSKDSLKLNSLAEAKIFATNIPGYTRIVDFLYFAGNKRLKVNYKILDSGYFLTIRFFPPKIGDGIIFLTAELKDEAKKIVKKDTLNRIVKVLK